MCDLGLSAGIRKDELFGDFALQRANFAWVDSDARPLPRNSTTLASRRKGDILRVLSAPSKCDQLNVEWGAKPMWFRLDPDNPLNFAASWLAYERYCPCPDGQERLWPAFSPEGDHRGFSGADIDGALQTLMRLTMSAEDIDTHTWHSFRVTLAMAIVATIAPGASHAARRDEAEAIAQALCRWKSIEAARIYARWMPAAYADYVERATRTNASLALDADLPEVFPTDVVIDIQSTITELEDASRATAVDRFDIPSHDAKALTHRNPASCATSLTNIGTARQSFSVGENQMVLDLGPESWNVVGLTASVHDSFWAGDKNTTHDCKVVGFVGAYSFPSGGISRCTYVIEHEDYCYPIRHTALHDSLPLETRRRIDKLPPPTAADSRPGAQNRTPPHPTPRTAEVTQRKRRTTLAALTPRTRQAIITPPPRTQRAPDQGGTHLSTSRPARANAAAGITRFTAGPAPPPSVAHRDARLRLSNRIAIDY